MLITQLKPARLMGECMRSLFVVSVAGLAVAASAQVLDRPIWQLPGGEIIFRDYPDQARSAGLTGKVEFRATTGADGTVQACQVTKGSGHYALDRESCRLLTMYAKFRPVGIKDGVQTVTGVVRWSPADAAALAANTVPLTETAEKKPPTPRFGWKKREVKFDRLQQ